MTDTIEIQNPGPIEGTFEIDLSTGPGVYEFRGARGSGKSTCISSIDWLAGHKVDVTLHDGAVSGKVTGFGVVAPIGGRKRRKGDLEVDTIDAERFSIVDLIDPQGKSPEVRDATAIKALAVLSGVQPDPSLYYDLAGGQTAFDELGVAVSDDPVMLATRVKKAYDELARRATATAESEARHAVPLEHVPEGVDISQSSDLEELGQLRDAARDELQRLKSERESGLETEAEAVKARNELGGLVADYSGPESDEAETELKTIEAEGVAAREQVEKLERELEKARDVVDACKVRYSAAKRTLEAATSHEAAVKQLEAVAAKSVEYPDEAAIGEATQNVEAATTEYDNGIRIRDTKENLRKAETHRAAEAAAAAKADEAKNKAGEVFDVFARSLNTQHLKIETVDGKPRLFVEHKRRGKTLFDRVNGLSDGERVDFTLRELLPHIESPGLLPIPQRVWQDLQPSDRAALHELAVENGLYLFGAQVDDGALRVNFLGDGVSHEEAA